MDKNQLAKESKTTYKCISVNIIQSMMDKKKTNENFYKVLEETRRKLSTKDITIVVTDFNAKVGIDNTAFEEEFGTNVNDSM